MSSCTSAPRYRRLQFETLETRLPLAGDVSVRVKGLDLFISGDNAQNALDISEGLDGNNLPAWIIEGINDPTGTDTTVNGGGQLAVRIPAGGFRNVTVTLKKGLTQANAAGIDTLLMAGLTIRGNLKVLGNNGGNVSINGVDVVGATTIAFKNGTTPGGEGTFVEVINSTIACGGKGFSISTGNDDDSIEIRNVVMGGTLSIRTKEGTNEVDISDSLIVKNASYLGGNGDDQLVITDTTVAGNFSVNVKKGENTVALLGTRAGDDGLTSSMLIGGNMKFTGGTGDDALGMLGVVIEKKLSANLGNGDNFAGAADLFVFGTTSIRAGSGDDVVAIGLNDFAGNPLPPGAFGNTLVGNVTISTGSGDDIVAASNTTFGAFDPARNRLVGGRITVKLGAGDDQLAEDGNTFVGVPDPFLAIRSTRGGSGEDTIFSALDPDERQLRFLQFEESNTPGGEAALFTAIFGRVDLHFGDILLDFGIDINP